MKRKWLKIAALGLAAIFLFFALKNSRPQNTGLIIEDSEFSAQSTELSIIDEPEAQSTVTDTGTDSNSVTITDEGTVKESGRYETKDEVASYIHLYGHLPKNYITKSQADEYGGRPQGMSIGGDRFYNRENRLPKKKGRTYTECDIDAAGNAPRGTKRIVFSSDGLIYYTADHYNTFELLYGDEANE